VLVVVKDGDVELRLQAFLDVETAGRGDVLQIDAAERRGDPLHGGDDLVGILRAEAEGKGVHPAEFLEQHRLAFHDRQGRGRTDVPEAQDG
jgi:hypothetical protein